MIRTLWTVPLILLGPALDALAQEPGAKPDPQAIARAGRASIKRFETEAASWSTTNLTPTGLKFVVEVVATPTRKRSILSVEARGRREELARITEKDGVWYVVQGRKAGKYRPFEAPLDIPTAYVYLNRSTPQFVSEPNPVGAGAYERASNGTAIFRNPLPDSQKALLRKTIAEFDEFKKTNAAKPEAERSIDSARALLKDGISTEVDLASGMLKEFGTPERRTKIDQFRWLRQVDPEVFATEGRDWDDQTDDPTTGDRDNLILIGHCGAWSPGMKSPETDGRLLDLKTGRFRRLPFQGDLTVPGCFVSGRSRVVVTGTDTTTGVLGLYEIDLKTGANRQLGGDLLATGFTLFPSISPDGKTLAVLHRGGSDRGLEAQICLVDLATGDARPVGKPRDTGPVSWFPDGRSLLIVDRKTVEMSKPPISTVCRMELTGAVKPLLKGLSPVIFPGGKSILFEDPDALIWKTCTLDGQDVKPYADGLRGHGFPAPSPDGKRLLMMHFRPGQAPEPLLLPAGQASGKPVTTAPGLWKAPAWR